MDDGLVAAEGIVGCRFPGFLRRGETAGVGRRALLSEGGALISFNFPSGDTAPT